MDTEKPRVVYGETDPNWPEFIRPVELDRRIEQEKTQKQKDEALEKRLRAQRGPKIELEGKPAFGAVANALKGFYPHMNRAERRQAVKNSRKKGKGYNK